MASILRKRRPIRFKEYSRCLACGARIRFTASLKLLCRICLRQLLSLPGGIPGLKKLLGSGKKGRNIGSFSVRCLSFLLHWC